MIMLVGNENMVEAGALAIVQFLRFGNEHITNVHGLCKVYARIERYAQIVSVIAGKGKGAVGHAEGNATVNDAKTIHHFFANGHAYLAVPFFYFQHFYAQPLAEAVVLHHVVYYLLWRECISHYSPVNIGFLFCKNASIPSA